MLASGERTCIDCHKGIAHRLPALPVTKSEKQVSMASP
jgi:nitrate/TMAO reductase-like tetraheme cytochrome c subunit